MMFYGRANINWADKTTVFFNRNRQSYSCQPQNESESIAQPEHRQSSRANEWHLHVTPASNGIRSQANRMKRDRTH